ncbi:MAG TPA: hypothetical protein VGH38_17785, partial [Bryobacteraceae bacterium]
ALCGVLYGMASALYLTMQAEAEPLTFLNWNGTVALLGKLTLGAEHARSQRGCGSPERGRSGCWC